MVAIQYAQTAVLIIAQLVAKNLVKQAVQILVRQIALQPALTPLKQQQDIITDQIIHILNLLKGFK